VLEISDLKSMQRNLMLISVVQEIYLFQGETETLNADLSSAGDLDAYNLKAKEVDVSASSAGDAKVNASEKNNRKSFKCGTYYQGDPKYVDTHSSSAGGIHKR